MQTNIAMMLISAQFYMFLITALLIIGYFGIKFYLKQRRIKKAYYFLTEGYKILSYDKDGIPLFVEKGGNIEKI